jgi:hypothetical protein
MGKECQCIDDREYRQQEGVCGTSKAYSDWQLLHERLGHPGCKSFIEMMKNMKIEVTKEDEETISEILRKCDTCIQAKSVKNQNHEPSPRARRCLQRVYMDFWGPYTKAPNGHRWQYYLSLTDDHSRLSWIHMTKDRKLETVQEILKEWLANVEWQTGNLLLSIRTDNTKKLRALNP